MNYLKSSLTLSAVLGLGLGTALLARVGLGATVGRGEDVPWYDRSLVGAAGGITPSALTPKLCPTCDLDRDWLAMEDRIAALRSRDPSGEAQLIASHLESVTVPLIAISDDRVVPVELRQIESPPTASALP